MAAQKTRDWRSASTNRGAAAVADAGPGGADALALAAVPTGSPIHRSPVPASTPVRPATACQRRAAPPELHCWAYGCSDRCVRRGPTALIPNNVPRRFDQTIATTAVATLSLRTASPDPHKHTPSRNHLYQENAHVPSHDFPPPPRRHHTHRRHPRREPCLGPDPHHGSDEQLGNGRYCRLV